MKRVALTSLALTALLALGNLGASEISGVLTTKAGASAPVSPTEENPLKFEQSDRIQILGELTITPNLSLNGSAFYQLGLDLVDTQVEISHSYDLSELVLTFNTANSFGPGSSFTIQAGRTLFNDFSAQVLAHKLDGFLVNIATPGFSSKVGIGTTAGLFKTGNAILINSEDLSDLSDKNEFLANPRLIALLELKKPDLLKGQNLSFTVLGQLDISPEQTKASDASSASSGVPVNTVYAGLGLDGKITSGLFYNFAGFFQSGTTLSSARNYEQDIIIAGMGNVGLTYFVPSLMNSKFSIGASASTGDTDLDSSKLAIEGNTQGFNNFFTGISKRGGGIIYTAQHGNNVVAKAGWTFKPVSGKAGDAEMAVSIDGQGLFRILGSGPVAEPLKDASDDLYLGSEVDASINFRPLSDLSLALRGGVFIPNESALDKPLTWKAGLDVSLSF